MEKEGDVEAMPCLLLARTEVAPEGLPTMASSVVARVQVQKRKTREEKGKTERWRRREEEGVLG